MPSAARRDGWCKAPISTNASVAKVNVVNGRATGVTLADGSVIDAKCVVSNLNPKLLYLDLIDAGQARVGQSRQCAKSGDGDDYWSQFSRGLVRALHRAGLRAYGPTWQAARGPEARASRTMAAFGRTCWPC